MQRVKIFLMTYTVDFNRYHSWRYMLECLGFIYYKKCNVKEKNELKKMSVYTLNDCYYFLSKIDLDKNKITVKKIEKQKGFFI